MGDENSFLGAWHPKRLQNHQPLIMALKPRKILKNVVKFLDLDKEQAIVIHGARQVGKTSLMKLAQEYLIQHKISQNNIFYFDLEDFAFLDLCNQGASSAVDYLKSKKGGLKEKTYLFIDEIQYLDNPSSFIKLLHDQWKDKIKLVVSGSSSFAIKSKFKNSLVGRIIDFEMFGLDFEEFLIFKESDLNKNSFSSLSPLIHQELKKLYQEYVLYGSYPAIVLEAEIENKSILLKQIINTYIKKDIRDIANIRYLNKFNKLLKILASQTGNLINVSNLADMAQLNQATVEYYLFILENTYVIKNISPFYKNLRAELTKQPKVYFEDTGLASLLSYKKFLEAPSGELFENSIYAEIRKNIGNIENLHFWRTNIGQEVDFICNDNKLIPIEAKMQFAGRNISGIRYFNDKYNLKESYICCLDCKTDLKENDNIKIIYPWQLSILFEKKE